MTVVASGNVQPAQSLALSYTDLWSKAYERLRDKDKDVLPLEQLPGPQEALDLVNQQVKVVKDKRLVVRTPKGGVIIVRDVLEKVAHWIKRFLQVGDVIVNYDPGHTALPWAAVRLILQVCVNDIDKHAAVLSGIDTVTQTLLWAKIQARLYLSADFEAKSQLEKSFEQLYFHILCFLSATIRFMKKGKGARALDNFLSDDSKYQTYLLAIKESKASIESWTSQIVRQDQLLTSSLIEQLLEISTELKSPVKRLEVINQNLADFIESQERERILDWLSEIPYQKHFTQVYKKVIRNTGKWLFESQDFLDWQNSSTSQVLWLHGIMGSGKSCLTAMLIHNMKEAKSPYPLYFFCVRNSAEKERSDPEAILRCILRQICDLSGIDGLYDKLVERYADRKTAGYMSLDECTEMLIEVASARSATFIVIDALDECDRETRQDLIDALQNVVAESTSLVKIFISSREDGDIKRSMDLYPNVRIEAEQNQQDIELFVSLTVDELIRKKRLLGSEMVTDELRSDIKLSLQDKAQGMFKWVELQLQYLCKLSRPSLVQKQLAKLPRDLAATYKQLYMSELEAREPEDCEIIKCAFSWLLVARCPLPSSDFIDMLCASTSGEIMTRETLLDLCFNLVVYNENEDFFRFSHLSVREFLEDHGKDTGIEIYPEDIVTRVCLNSLVYGNDSNKTIPNYTYWFWGYHLANCSEYPREAKMFLTPGSKSFERWHEYMMSNVPVYITRSNSDLAISIHRSLSSSHHPVFAICEWGLTRALEGQLDAQTVGLKNRSGLNGLELASSGGHEQIVRLLLEFQMHLGQRDRDVALRAATSEGHERIVQLLLQHGADVNGDRYDSKPLQTASEWGHEKVVQVLLDNGADINRQGGIYGNAIQAALYSRNRRIVPLLLKNGADIEALGRNGGSALCLAAGLDDEENVKIFLHHGANVNAMDEYGTPLHRASSGGHERIAQILLDHGADVNAGTDEIGTPLCVASSEGKLEIVKFLLDHGANVDAMNDSHETALHLALDLGIKPIVETLLDHGADVNAVDDDHYTALHLASLHGNEHLVELLLKYGADVNALLEHGDTPLHLASLFGYEHIIKVLLDWGVRVNATSAERGTALYAAAKQHGRIQVVKLLLDRGGRFYEEASEYREWPFPSGKQSEKDSKRLSW